MGTESLVAWYHNLESSEREGAGDRGSATHIEELRESEWSNEFETLMRNRLVVGGLRYGKFGKSSFRYMQSLRAHLESYEKTGNTERLVDIANYAMLEFAEPSHPRAHFKAVDR
jgi:hypothetical protein